MRYLLILLLFGCSATSEVVTERECDDDAVFKYFNDCMEGLNTVLSKRERMYYRDVCTRQANNIHCKDIKYQIKGKTKTKIENR